MSKQLKNAFRPTVEALEQRNLLAVVQLVNSGAQGGTLVVEGAETADYIVVRQEGGQIYVTNATTIYDIHIQATGKLQKSVWATSVKNVLIRGNGGQDYIYFANAAGAPAPSRRRSTAARAPMRSQAAYRPSITSTAEATMI